MSPWQSPGWVQKGQSLLQDSRHSYLAGDRPEPRAGASQAPWRCGWVCHWDVVKLGSASQQEEASSHLEGVGAVFLLPLLCVCPSPAWNSVFTICSGPCIREPRKCGEWYPSLPLPVSGFGVPHHLGSLSFSDPEAPVQASARPQPSWQLHLPFQGTWRLWTHSLWPTQRQSGHCCCTMLSTVPR